MNIHDVRGFITNEKQKMRKLFDSSLNHYSFCVLFVFRRQSKSNWPSARIRSETESESVDLGQCETCRNALEHPLCYVYLLYIDILYRYVPPMVGSIVGIYVYIQRKTLRRQQTNQKTEEERIV